jgi:hypothetical protein
MGENDHELVYGLPCQEESNQRLFGMPRIVRKAPNDKHQISNKLQTTKFKNPNKIVSEF